MLVLWHRTYTLAYRLSLLDLLLMQVRGIRTRFTEFVLIMHLLPQLDGVPLICLEAHHHKHQLYAWIHSLILHIPLPDLAESEVFSLLQLKTALGSDVVHQILLKRLHEHKQHVVIFEVPLHIWNDTHLHDLLRYHPLSFGGYQVADALQVLHARVWVIVVSLPIGDRLADLLLQIVAERSSDAQHQIDKLALINLAPIELGCQRRPYFHKVWLILLESL